VKDRPVTLSPDAHRNLRWVALTGGTLILAETGHPAAAVITALAMLVGSVAAIIEARALTSEVRDLRNSIIELRERVSRIEGR
jgi:hypothetical protein